jgi:hypothetical protein
MGNKILLAAVLLCAAALLFPTPAAAQTSGPAMRFPSPDIERPISWVPLAKYIPEKSPLGDPVAEASKALAMVGGAVFRPAPVAYQKMTLPDPFENRHLLRLPGVVAEEPAPPLLLPKK